MYTMIYTVTIYILCTEVQYIVHTIVYIVNMDDVSSSVVSQFTFFGLGKQKTAEKSDKVIS
jgi:hypothetical protein